MIIEIHGAGFKNKGAELMLRATCDELQKRLPQSSLAIDPTYGDYELRARLGLHQILPPRTHTGTPGRRTSPGSTLRVLGQRSVFVYNNRLKPVDTALTVFNTTSRVFQRAQIE